MTDGRRDSPPARGERRLPRRFYATVALAETEAGYGLRLDGRVMRTPGRRELVVPHHGLARAMVHEWEAQAEYIDPVTMPLTRLANTAVDRIAPDRTLAEDEILRFAETDLLCYRADHPAALVQRQSLHWDPVLAWIERRHGVCLSVITGIVYQQQPSASIGTLRRLLEQSSACELAGYHLIASLTGSAVLAMAVGDGAVDADAAWAAANVEEDWQRDQWGTDVVAVRRRAEQYLEFQAAVRFLALSRGESEPAA